MTLSVPLKASKLSLNFLAIAAFFGGKEASTTMASIHLVQGRRWLGWFNSPGSYATGSQFARMSNWRFWSSLFAGVDDPPVVSLGLDGKEGPEYIAALSGRTMPTGHLAYLAMERCKELKIVEIGLKRGKEPLNITYLAMKPVRYDVPVEQVPLTNTLLGLVPIVVSIVVCIVCAVVRDWFGFSTILIGIVCGGLGWFIISQESLVIKPAKNQATNNSIPPGHGILKGEENVMVIKGKESDVYTITKGRFDFKIDLQRVDEEMGAVFNHHFFGICSVLLCAQSLAQLVLVAHGTAFGQVMFLCSIITSWAYHGYLCSLEKEKMQTKLLFQTLGNPEMCGFRADTRATMGTFVCLLVFHGVQSNLPEEDERELRIRMLRSCVPYDTVIWRQWTDMVVDQLLNIDYDTQELPYLRHEQLDNPQEDQEMQHNEEMEHIRQNPKHTDQQTKLSEEETNILNQLLDDATAAFTKYFEIYETLPIDSSQSDVKEKNRAN